MSFIDNNKDLNSIQKLKSIGIIFKEIDIIERNGKAKYLSINSSPDFSTLSLEELRYNDYTFSKTGLLPLQPKINKEKKDINIGASISNTISRFELLPSNNSSNNNNNIFINKDEKERIFENKTSNNNFINPNEGINFDNNIKKQSNFLFSNNIYQKQNNSNLLIKNNNFKNIFGKKIKNNNNLFNPVFNINNNIDNNTILQTINNESNYSTIQNKDKDKNNNDNTIVVNMNKNKNNKINININDDKINIDVNNDLNININSKNKSMSINTNNINIKSSKNALTVKSKNNNNIENDNIMNSSSINQNNEDSLKPKRNKNRIFDNKNYINDSDLLFTKRTKNENKISTIFGLINNNYEEKIEDEDEDEKVEVNNNIINHTERNFINNNKNKYISNSVNNSLNLQQISNLEKTFNQKYYNNPLEENDEEKMTINCHIMEPYTISFSLEIEKNMDIMQLKKIICEELINKNKEYNNLNTNSFFLMKNYTIIKELGTIGETILSGDDIYIALKK